MLLDLPSRIAALPADLRGAWERIFALEVAGGRLEPTPAMEPWIERHFGDVASVREQTVVRVLNRLTLEAAQFNPLRARRPSGQASGDAELEEWIAGELADDIFAEPLRDTPADVFGRIVGRHCVSASNIAKYEGWHGLVIFDEPHPLRFGREQVRDYLDVALRWVDAAHAADPRAIYPAITWNCLPKSGATIVHGHMQIALGRGFPYARAELWRRAAAGYRAATGRSYVADLLALHEALGLAARRPGGLPIFAHLTPLRAREVVILADAHDDTKTERAEGGLSPALPVSMSARLPAQALADAIYDVLRALIDGQGVRAFNLGIALPPIGPAPEDWSDIPAIARVSDRGAALTHRNDLGAMELYATGVVSEDPFAVAAGLREALG